MIFSLQNSTPKCRAKCDALTSKNFTLTHIDFIHKLILFLLSVSCAVPNSQICYMLPFLRQIHFISDKYQH